MVWLTPSLWRWIFGGGVRVVGVRAEALHQTLVRAVAWVGLGVAVAGRNRDRFLALWASFSALPVRLLAGTARQPPLLGLLCCAPVRLAERRSPAFLLVAAGLCCCFSFLLFAVA